MLTAKNFLYLELLEIKHQLEKSMGKEEFERQLSRQRSTLSESQSQTSEGDTHTPGSPTASGSR